MHDLIEVDELLPMLPAPALRILDCRFDLVAPEAGREFWLEGHVPGALHADLDKHLAGPVTSTSGRHPLPDRAELAGWLGAQGIAAESTVVVYDAANSAIAARAWWLLRWIGHADVRVLNGGYRAWLAAGGPVETGVPVPRTACTYRVAASVAAKVATTAEILAELGSDRLALVDARDAARFAGEFEPLDAVAGHIPGSVNLPFGSLVGEDGKFRSRREIAELFRNVPGEGQANREWTVMCGSGVTACHLALAARIAGLCEPRLFAGSWSEWIRDPGRPVASAGK